MTTLLTNTRKADITIGGKYRILITAPLVRSLDLHEGDIVNIAFDKGESYLYVKLKAEKVFGRHSGRLYPPYRNASVLCVNSKHIATTILNKIGRKHTAALAVGDIVTLPYLGKAATIIMHHLESDTT